MITTHPELETAPMARNEATSKTSALHLANPAFNTARSLVAVARSDLSITVKNGIATLSGKTDSLADANMVEYLVSRMKGVSRVINLINHA